MKQRKPLHIQRVSPATSPAPSTMTPVPQPGPAAQPTLHSGSTADFSTVTFESMAGLSRETVDSLTQRMHFQYATCVQALCIPVCLSGADALVKARTGSGKTLGFLIPTVERLRTTPGCILVLEPTRELACQTADEARNLLANRPNCRVMAVYGGTNPRREADDIRRARPLPTVIAATPGRLLDHLQPNGTGSGLAQALKDAPLRSLVFDEADDLLDMGFRPTIERILALLPPKEQRQTLLFSATFPADIRSLAEFSLRKGFASVDAVIAKTTATAAASAVAIPTVELCEQEYESVALADQISVLLARIMQERAAGGKVIVFFATARITAFFASLWRVLPNNAGGNVIELHSRMSQSARTRSRDAFLKGGAGSLLFSSDLSARGVDYPDVTLVLQVGMAADKTQYVHRLGRTARAGKEGRGLLLLCDFETPLALSQLRGIPIKRVEPLRPTAMRLAAEIVAGGLQNVAADIAAAAYRTWIGYYNSSASKIGWTPAQLVQHANEWSRIIGCKQVPGIARRAIGKMGLRGVPGIVIESEESFSHRKQQKQQPKRQTTPPSQPQAKRQAFLAPTTLKP